MPQLQILSPRPSFGEELGQQLGGGISQGLSQSLNNMLEQKKKTKALKGLSPLFKEVGIDDEKINEIIQSGLDPKDAIGVLKLLQSQKQLEAYNQSLGGGQNFNPQESVSSQMGSEAFPQQTETRIAAAPSPSSSRLKPVYFSDQLPRPVNAGQIMQHAQARQQAIIAGNKETKDYRKKISDEALQAEELDPILKRALQLSHKESVSGVSGYLQAKAGERFPFLKGADVKELSRLAKETALQRFRADFGGKPSASEFFYINDVYFKPGDPKESLIRNIRFEQQLAKLKSQREKIVNQVLQERPGEYPMNLAEIVSERMKPYNQQMLKNLGYDEWAKKNSKEVKDIDSGEKRVKVKDSSGKVIGDLPYSQINELSSEYSFE